MSEQKTIISLPPIAYGKNNRGEYTLEDKRFTQYITVGAINNNTNLFYEFLLEHNSLKIYIINVLENRKPSFKLRERAPSNWIITAFNWDSARSRREGSWYSLSALWEEHFEAFSEE